MNRYLLTDIYSRAIELAEGICGVVPGSAGEPSYEWACSRPRQIAFWLIRKTTHDSYAVIGKRFGGKCHGTIMHGIRSVDKRMKADSYFREQCRDALANLRDFLEEPNDPQGGPERWVALDEVRGASA